MRAADTARLLLLAAIWGGSFLLLRMVAPVLGAMLTAESRVFVAGVALSIWMAIQGTRTEWRRYALPLLIVAITNSALPFAFFSYAALTLPSGYSAILNATAPLFSALFAAIFLGERLTPRKLIGLACGIGGVSFLVGLGPIAFDGHVGLAVASALSGALSYAIASAYVKGLKDPVPPTAMATGSQVLAALVLLPLVAVAPLPSRPDAQTITLILVSGVVCTAMAYLLYFRLIRDIGPVKALTVTFLVPLTALAWGAVVLDEAITLRTLVGGALVILATWLVLTAGAQAPATRTAAVPPDAR
jgi:drug/metabolite transporter (DMT)-like permease